MSGSPTNLSIVILREHRQYEAWKNQTKTSANEHDIYRYIDPDIQDGLHPILTEPTIPTPSDIVPPQDAASNQPPAADAAASGGDSPSERVLHPTQVSDLDSTQRAQYELEIKLFVRKLKRYDRQYEALRKMMTIIQQTIDLQFVSITYDCDTAKNMMIKVRDRFKPDDISTQRELYATWKRLTRPQ